MKKALILVFLVVLLFATNVMAADQHAIDHSQACVHASETGKANASENSVLASCSEEPPPV